MYNCELYSVRSNQQDLDVFNEKIDDIASLLYERDIRVLYNTEIDPSAKAFSKALNEAETSAEAPDYYIFVNALDSQDSSSFKSLFYDFIRESENLITPTDENKDKIAKVKISTLNNLGSDYPGYCFKIFDKRYIVLPQATLCNCELTFLISKAVDMATEIFKKNEEENPDGLAFVDAPPKKKEGFFMSFIPHKGDSQNRVIRKVVVLIAIIAILISGGYIINDLVIQPYLNEQLTAEIHDIAYGGSENKKTDPNAPDQDWKALKKINKEIVGWITIDGTKIDYPVLYHKGDNNNSQYYLYRTYKKKPSNWGSIFLDFQSTDSVKSKNVTLHGHNMQDSTMFSSLPEYGGLTGNLKYYKKHPIIKFNTPEEDAEYKIISIFKTNTLYEHGVFFNYMQGEFGSDAEFMNFVYNCKIRSLIDCPVDVNEDDKLLTLSTCSYEFTNFRTVIVARKVRKGESSKVDLDSAKLNSSPVFPDVYYSSRGGKKPEVLTFKKAYDRGLIDWYDGKGNLKGSETLSGTVAANPSEVSTDADGNVTAILERYTVTFANWDGTEYYSTTVPEGSSVKPPKGTPKLPKDDYYNYEFTGWNTKGVDLKNVQYNMTIYPEYTATLK